MRTYDKIVIFGETKLREDFGTLDFMTIVCKYLIHGTACFDHSVWRDPFPQKILARYLTVGHIDVAYVIDNPAVDLLGNPLVEATVPGFHVEDRNLQALCRYRSQATVRVAE